MRWLMRSKIHNATVTEANVAYIGSITIDEDLLDLCGLWAGERVLVVSNTSGARLETYTIAGERGSGVIGINGAAAHQVHVGDLVILITYAEMTTEEARSYEPKVVHVGKENQILQLGNDPAEAHTPGLMRPPHALNNAAHLS